MAPSLAAMNNTHRYMSWKHQPNYYGEEEPLPSLPIMYSILEISHEKQERCKHDVVDEMCMMYCKKESSYMEEISLSHHKKKSFSLLYEFQALTLVNTAWISMVCGLT